jgi:hypothetical protein
MAVLVVREAGLITPKPVKWSSLLLELQSSEVMNNAGSMMEDVDARRGGK